VRQIVSELAPTGVLRAGINMSNFLLVTGKSASGDPQGVSPDMAREIATHLGVPVKYMPYARPGEIADDAEKGLWDIGLIGAEPQRAEKIAFTPAYVEIEATYLVPAGSPLKSIADVDKPGVRIAVSARSASPAAASRRTMGKIHQRRRSVAPNPPPRATVCCIKGTSAGYSARRHRLFDAHPGFNCNGYPAY